MKQYLLSLRSGDFAKQNNVWVSNAINLYSNSSYINYSNIRSNTGLNLIGDYTYTGIEVASPSSTGVHATPTSNSAIYATDVGEVVIESASPSVQRFIDTSSRVDILAYKHAFTNLSGTEVPGLKLTVYESDTGLGNIRNQDGTETGLWLRSAVSQNTSTLLIKDSKKFIKVELEITSELSDLSTVGLILYIEVGIHDVVSPVLSSSTKRILKKFPSWTKIFDDSIDDATPTLQTAQSSGGKLVNALIGEDLENLSIDLDYINLNKYIQSADTGMLDWIYVIYNVPANVMSVYADGVQLGKTGSLSAFFESRVTDFIYYHNISDKQIIVNRKYSNITINGNSYDSDAFLVVNDFDNFGAMVGLPRLHLETNERYKKRILDVYINQPGVSLQGLKNALRRELDLWKAYGTTPDSGSTGYFPVILQMEDIESSSPYFSDSGIPQDKFKAIVQDLNSRYPSNYGYVKWDEGVWDYAGELQEGVNRLPAIYDGSSPTGEYYKSGIGDFDDIKFVVNPDVTSTVSFTGHIEVQGVKSIGQKEYYPQINLDYEYSLAYERIIPDYDKSRVSVGLTYLVHYSDYGIAATPAVFYVNLNKDNASLPQNIRDLMYVGNSKFANDAASPEYNAIRIFNSDGKSNPGIIFKKLATDGTSDEIFVDHHSTPQTNTLPLFYRKYQNNYTSSPEKISVKLTTAGWDSGSSSYLSNPASPPSSTDYWFRFIRPNNTSSPTYDSSSPTFDSPSHLKTIEVASPFSSVDKANFIIHSNLYPGKNETYLTTPIIKSVALNALNDLTDESITDYDIQISDLYNSILYPQDATPKRIYVNVTKFDDMVGGYSYYPIDENTYAIPSSPSIVYRAYDSANQTVGSEEYFESATINYSNTIPYRTNSTPNISKINVYHNESDTTYYPFVSNIYESYRYTSTPFISGYIDDKGNAYESTENSDNIFYNSDKYLSTYTLTKGSLGIDPADTTEHYINNVIFKSNNDYIELIPNLDMSNLSTRDQFNEDIFNAQSTGYNVELSVQEDVNNLYASKSGIKPGWLFLNEENYYVYSKPIIDVYSAIYYDLALSQVPRDGAPVLVKVDNKEKRHVSFSDEATPSKLSIINKETVYGNYGNNLYAAYSDIYDIEVVDEYTGTVLKTGLSSSTNAIQVFNSATPAVLGRAYTIRYKVKDSFILDKDYYDLNTDTYYSKITFDATPAATVNYEIVYESDRYQSATPLSLDINAYDNPLSEGFVYMSDNEYEFDTAKVTVSPNRVRDTNEDLMYITIHSYDTHGNFKPNQTFQVTGPYITATPQYLTTNENGYGTGVIRYYGPVPSTTPNSFVHISGLTSSNSNAHPNSIATPYSTYVQYSIDRQISNNISISATSTYPSLDADGTSSQVITGYVYNSGAPVGENVVVFYRKARTLKSLFESSRENYVLTDSNGRFTIQNITTQNSTNPGHWLFAVETNGTTSIPSLETRQSTTFTTLAGDIVYWNEKNSETQFVNETAPVPYWYRHLMESNSSNLSTPMFMTAHHNEDITFVTHSTPNWIGQKWLAIPKYEQYQLGILGSTPNTITVYDNIHPDYEED